MPWLIIWEILKSVRPKGYILTYGYFMLSVWSIAVLLEKVIRIAHLGYVDTIVAISVLEMALCKFGVTVEFVKGVGAA